MIKTSDTYTFLKILFFEDPPQNVEICRRIIIDSGCDLDIDISATEKEFESFLHNNSYDVILSDFNLPGLDAFGALRLANKICPDVPFICVSDFISKETGIDLIKSGAVDYVYKDKLDKLPFAIKRAVNDANEKVTRQKTIDLLAASEARYRRLFESAKDGILILEVDTGMIIDVNPFLIDLLDYSKEQFSQKKIWDIGFFKDIVANYDKFLELQQSEYVRYENLPLETAKGRKINVEFVSNVYTVNSHRVIQCNIRDITKNRIAEKAVRESEKRFRAIFDQAPIGMALLDLKGNLTIANLPLAQMIGYTTEELVNMKFTDFTYPDDIDKDVNRFTELINGKINQYSMEKRYFHKNGNIVWVNIIATMLNDENGLKREIIGMANNITEYKLSKELLQDSEERFRHAFEYAASGICIVGLNSKFQRINNALKEMIGYEEDEMKNFTFNDITHPDDLEIGLDLFNNMVSGKIEKASFEKRYIRKDKQIVWAHVSVSLVLGKDHKPHFFIAQVIDITEQKRAVKELIESKANAISANKLKDGFIANISHEIRTPLNGIVGMASLIRDTYYDNIKKEDEELFEGIEISSKRIMRTVDMILNYSLMQIGEFPVFPKKISLTLICIKLIKEYNTTAKFKSLELKFRNDGENVEIFVDEYSISMAISHLIDNAIKFTIKGGVEVILNKGIDNEVFLEVKDTGIGISDEFLGNIFDPYRQEQMGHGRAYEGVGLGLSLVKKIIDLNNIAISVDSKKGIGTTFSINFGIN